MSSHACLLLTLNDGNELAGHEAHVPPAAVEDLQGRGRDAEERHHDAGDRQVRDVHVARAPVLLSR